MAVLALCTLTPQASLAAVRFLRPVHVHSIRIIPTSDAPLPHLNGFASCTEPASFSLDVFFNWQTLPTGSEKPKHSNVLLHSTLRYEGDLLEYEVDESEEMATRLVILQGPFTSITLAVYGAEANDPNKDAQAVSVTYDPCPLPPVTVVSLPSFLDLGRITDPLAPSKRLISAAAIDVDILGLIRRTLAFGPSPSDTDANFDQLLHSYEIGEDWIKELLDVLGSPVDPRELSDDVLPNLSERTLESLAQSPSFESVSQLVSLMARHPPALVDCLLPVLLSSEVVTSSVWSAVTASIAEASVSPYVCERVRSFDLGEELDDSVLARVNENCQAWDELLDGHVDAHWISQNLWKPGFLPILLEKLDSAEIRWPPSTRIQVAIAGMLSVFLWDQAELSVGPKARAVLDIWVCDEYACQVLQDAITQPVIQSHLSTEAGQSFLKHVTSITHDSAQDGVPHSANGTGNGVFHHSYPPSITTGDLEAAVDYLHAASRRWPDDDLQRLNVSLQTVHGRIVGDDDVVIVTRAFWRHDASAVQCMCQLFLECCDRIPQSNWSLSDSAPVRRLLNIVLSFLAVLQQLVPEYGVLSSMMPRIARASISLLISARQPTYATRYSAETGIRQECELLLCRLTEMDEQGHFLHAGAATVLPSLLQDGLKWDEGVDPVSRVTAAADLFTAVIDVEKSAQAEQGWAHILITHLTDVHSLLCALEPSKALAVVDVLKSFDDADYGIVEWLILERLQKLEEYSDLPEVENAHQSPSLSSAWATRQIGSALQFFVDVSKGHFDEYLEPGNPVGEMLIDTLWTVWAHPTREVVDLTQRLSSRSSSDPKVRGLVAAVSLRACLSGQIEQSILDLLPSVVDDICAVDTEVVKRPLDLLLTVGYVICRLSETEDLGRDWIKGEKAVQAALSLLDSAITLASSTNELPSEIPVATLSQSAAARFTEYAELLLTPEQAATVSSLMMRLSLPTAAALLPVYTPTSEPSASSLAGIVEFEKAKGPSSPLIRPVNVLGGMQPSPPTARTTSPVASLAKTYSNNDFRELRAQPSARLNTSRPPSRHVDDFEQGTAAGVAATPNAETVPVPVPMPLPIAFAAAQLPALPLPAAAGTLPFYTI